MRGLVAAVILSGMIAPGLAESIETSSNAMPVRILVALNKHHGAVNFTPVAGVRTADNCRRKGPINCCDQRPVVCDCGCDSNGCGSCGAR
jgi:hypothetical protein